MSRKSKPVDIRKLVLAKGTTYESRHLCWYCRLIDGSFGGIDEERACRECAEVRRWSFAFHPIIEFNYNFWLDVGNMYVLAQTPPPPDPMLL